LHLVLLHPLPLDGSIWPAALHDLADVVHAPTLYSSGPSLADWASAVVSRLPPGPIVVVGNSIGGSCALEVAALVPERVRAMVLIGAKAGVRPEPAFRDEAVRVLREEGVDAAWRRYWAPLFAPDTDPEVTARARDVALHQPVDHLVDGVWAFHTRPDRAALLAQLPVPVFVVRGEHDSIGRRTTPPLIDGRVIDVPRAGHYVPVEDPGATVAVVRAALEASAGGR
jgi:pimeloyl-ACP methyl ester carboxylesterase